MGSATRLARQWTTRWLMQPEILSHSSPTLIDSQQQWQWQWRQTCVPGNHYILWKSGYRQVRRQLTRPDGREGTVGEDTGEGLCENAGVGLCNNVLGAPSASRQSPEQTKVADPNDDDHEVAAAIAAAEVGCARLEANSSLKMLPMFTAQVYGN